MVGEFNPYNCARKIHTYVEKLSTSLVDEIVSSLPF